VNKKVNQTSLGIVDKNSWFVCYSLNPPNKMP